MGNVWSTAPFFPHHPPVFCIRSEISYQPLTNFDHLNPRALPPMGQQLLFSLLISNLVINLFIWKCLSESAPLRIQLEQRVCVTSRHTFFFFFQINFIYFGWSSEPHGRKNNKPQIGHYKQDDICDKTDYQFTVGLWYIKIAYYGCFNNI